MDVGDPDGHGQYGVLDDDGECLLCHECGARFTHLGLHAWRGHGITAPDYRQRHGLRSSEANRLDWPLVHVDDSGVMSIEVTKEIAKGGIPRAVLVLHPRVADRMLERRARAHGQGYVIGAPSDRRKLWEQRNRDKAAAAQMTAPNSSQKPSQEVRREAPGGSSDHPHLRPL